MESKDISPKVHLFGIKSPEELKSLLGIDAKGEKFQVLINTLKPDLLPLIDRISELEEKLVTLENRLNEEGTTSVLNIIGNKEVEKRTTVGLIYSDGNKIRTRFKDGWKDIR